MSLPWKNLPNPHRLDQSSLLLFLDCVLFIHMPITGLSKVLCTKWALNDDLLNEQRRI